MRQFTIFILTLIVHLTAYSQIRDYKVNNLSGDDGLPTDNILYAYQDSFGFLWMASYEGLMRWDGYEYKKYFHSPDDSSSLSGNIVYTIFEDYKNRLWIGTIDGLSLYDRERERFIRCDLGKETDKIPINDIREDSHHQLWLGTSYGLCRFDYDRDITKWYVHDPLNVNSLSHDVIFRLSVDSRDNLWIATFEGGVNKFTPSTGTFTRFLHKRGDSGTIASSKIKSILVDHEDNVWIGTYDKGVTLLNGEGEVVRQFPHLPRSRATGFRACLV